MLVLLCASLSAADEVEFLTGSKLTGTLVEQTADKIRFKSNGLEVTFPISKVHALTLNGSRKVLNEKTPVAAAAAPAAPAANAATGGKKVAGNNTKTRAEVDTIIDAAGKAQPDWWNTVKVNYPPTLDLKWTQPKGGWDPQKNLGQYLWSVINENPGKWKEGARLLFYTLEVNKDDSANLTKSMNALGHIYAELLEDYARGAFWWRKAGAGGATVDLAICYWKLGNTDMAKEMLTVIGADDTRHGSVIKAWADMGEYDTAIKLAEEKAKNDKEDIGYLMAGDACRLAGKYQQAIDYYKKALAATRPGRDVKQSKGRAQASIDAINVYDRLDLKKIPDGTYSSDSFGYSGQVFVDVVVKGAKIETVKVAKHTEKQYYASMNYTPAQIIAKQGVKGVDAFASATITSEAIINATAKALASGAK
jgi:uncharacterized protein with FMN-binding domain